MAMQNWFLSVALALCTACGPSENRMSTKPDAVQQLQALSRRDNFSGDPKTLYSGVADPVLRAKLNLQFRSAVDAFSIAVQRGSSQEQYQKVLVAEIQKFDRDSLDTEDAEQVAACFEKAMDAMGLDSSDGALNNWMYGFDPGQR
jgi:hypothetical protein